MKISEKADIKLATKLVIWFKTYQLQEICLLKIYSGTFSEYH